MAIAPSAELDFLTYASERYLTHPPQSNTDEWGVNNSDFSNYCAYAPRHYDYEKIITSRLAGLATRTAIDIAGGVNGRAIQELIDEGLVDQGVVTNMKDRRVDYGLASGVDHIEGNICLADTWQKIIDWQHEKAPEGFSLVMHRPVGALQELPAEFYAGALRFLLQRIQPGGMLFSQIPAVLSFTDNDSKKALCEELFTREDINKIYAPEYFQPRPMALILKE
jgi:hypothetical protein